MRVFLFCSIAPLVVLELLVAPASAIHVTIAQLRALAADAMQSGDVVYRAPSSKVVHATLWVKDVGPLSDQSKAAHDYWFDGGDPLKAVFLDQLAIEIRRQRLFAGTRQQLIIEPFYRQMEEIVAAELSLVQGRGDDEQKTRQLDERLRQLGDVLQTGIEACAKDMRLTGSFVEHGEDDGAAWIDRIFGIYLPRTGQITFRQLDDAVNQAIRDGTVTFEMPTAVVDKDSLRVTDIRLSGEMTRELDPIEEIVAESVKLALRRAHLLRRPENRARMESVYRQMEALLRRQLDSLRQAGMASGTSRSQPGSNPADESDKNSSGGTAGRSTIGQELDDLLIEGLRDCAQSMGDLSLDYTPRPLSDVQTATTKIKLVAPPGTAIDVVHNTDHKLWSLAGKSQNDYPWESRKAGDAVDLLGGYWFRLTYSGGRRTNLYKKVGANGSELRFPGQ